MLGAELLQISLTCTEAVKAGLLKLTLTVFTRIVIPSMTLWMKLYFPIGTESDWIPPPAVGVPERAISHVSTEIFTSSSDSVIGTLFSFAHDMRKVMWLHHASVSRSHEGNSRSSVNTFSSSWRFVSSPSPLKVDILILSLERFFVYLKNKLKLRWVSRGLNTIPSRWVIKNSSGHWASGVWRGWGKI